MRAYIPVYALSNLISLHRTTRSSPYRSAIAGPARADRQSSLSRICPLRPMQRQRRSLGAAHARVGGGGPPAARRGRACSAVAGCPDGLGCRPLALTPQRALQLLLGVLGEGGLQHGSAVLAQCRERLV